LVIQGGGSGISGISTAASVLILPLGTIFLCFYAFRSWTASLGALVAAFILSVLLSVIVVNTSAALGQKGFNSAPNDLCVPITSSTSCHQAIFVDHATDQSLSSDAVQVETDRLG
jgi:hypothetical protein